MKLLMRSLDNDYSDMNSFKDNFSHDIGHTWQSLRTYTRKYLSHNRNLIQTWNTNS